MLDVLQFHFDIGDVPGDFTIHLIIVSYMYYFYTYYIKTYDLGR